jgi:hypothetical protein
MSTSARPTHSIFEEPWWLDATAPGEWDAVEIEEGGRVVARLPFVFKKRYGLRTISQPPLTQTLGPWIEQTEERQDKRIAREKDLFTKLIGKLPKSDRFDQNFHPNVSNWLPFYWSGHTQTTRYTYVLRDIEDHSRVLAGMSGSTRRNIRMAESSLEIVENSTVDIVLDLAEKTFQRQGLKTPYDTELLHRIDDAVKQNAHRVALHSIDGEGRIHSAAYVVGDERRSYLLVTGADPSLAGSKSGSLVHSRAIKAAAQFTAIFDFEGSMIEGVESFYRSFGSTQTPYSNISRYNGKGGRLISLKHSILG